MARLAPEGLNTTRLKDEIVALYGRLADQPRGEFHFETGAAYAAGRLGYDPAELAALPAGTTASFAGVGNPHGIAPIRAGETVLDIGCGAGTDLLLAARRVGPGGKAIGVDITASMRARARASAEQLGLTQVEIRAGDALDLPVESGSVDVVISNGVLNLTPDKLRAFREIFRVLKPGGRLQLADIVIGQELSQDLREDIDLWTGWIAGALPEAEIVEFLEEAGFRNARVGMHFDPFAGSEKADVARKFGVVGVNVSACKASRVGSYLSRLLRRRPARGRRERLAVGTQAPDFTLGCRSGAGRFRLADHRGRQLLLFFVPSEWCPVCQVGLRVYAAHAAALAQRDVKLVVVSSIGGASTEAFARKFGLDYLVLEDKKSKVARAFGATAPGCEGGLELPLPCSFLLDAEGVVRYAAGLQDGGFLADEQELARLLAAMPAPRGEADTGAGLEYSASCAM